MELQITVIFAQRLPPDLQLVEKVLAEIMVKVSQRNLPPPIGHLQSTTKRPFGIFQMSNFTAINGRADNLLQTNKTKNKKACIFLFEKYILFQNHLAFNITSEVISLQKYLVGSFFQPL